MVISDVECVLHISCRMIRREIQPFKIVIICVDIWAVLNRKTHTYKDTDDLIQCLSDWMRSSQKMSSSRQRDVEFFFFELFYLLYLLIAVESLFAKLRDFLFEQIN